MSAMVLHSFRFSRQDLANLDKVVAWERSKGPMLLPHMQPSRTSVIKALVERELLRLAEEEERIRSRLDRANHTTAGSPEAPLERFESPKERKTRLQRERRARERTKVACPLDAS